MLDAGGLVALFNYTNSETDFTTGENVIITAEFGTTNAESQLAVDWYVFADDADFPEFFASPENGSADVPFGGETDVDDILDTQLTSEPISGGNLSTPALPVDEFEGNVIITFDVSADSIFDLRPNTEAGSARFLLVARLSAPGIDGGPERFEWFATPFGVEEGVGPTPEVGPVAGPTSAVLGQPLTFTAGGEEASLAFTEVVHSWVVFDQATSEVVGGGSEAALDFTPTYAGNFVVTYVASTETTQAAAEPLLLTVGAQALVGDQLHIGAQQGGSNVFVTNGSQGITVEVDGVAELYTGLGQIVVYGQQGSDIVLIGSSVTTPVTVFGGAGSDLIAGGSGGDVLVGGEGGDVLLGGAGRDLIIGGDGGDILLGNASDDIIIAGYTAYDADTVTLSAMLAYWGGSDSFATRIATLRDTLLNQSTVFDDDDTDLLAGNAGTDWFFANLASDNQSGDRRDLVLDRSAAEFQAYQELMNQG